MGAHPYHESKVGLHGCKRDPFVENDVFHSVVLHKNGLGCSKERAACKLDPKVRAKQ